MPVLVNRMPVLVNRCNVLAHNKLRQPSEFLISSQFSHLIKDDGSKWKKLENQKLSFVTFVVTIFNSNYYTNENYWLNLC
jgi:hypothetical protein